MRTANPALSDKVFNQIEQVSSDAKTMTVQGTIYKTATLLGLVLLTAMYTWNLFYTAINGLTEPEAIMNAGMKAVMPWMIGGLVLGLVFALITIFVPKVSPFTAPLYALAEGLALGGISALFEIQYPGIVLPAVGLTFGVLAVMLGLYGTGIIKVTQKLRMGITAATGGIMLVYVIAMGMSFFGMNMPIINDATPLGIGFSLLVVGIAAFNLVLDFDFIEKGANHGLPRYMEWYGAFGLMVTLVWLYMELLRLLSKMRK